MRIIVCDLEVTKFDWIFVGKELNSKEHFVVHNDNDRLKSYIEQDDTIFCGFNIKGYDQFIIKAICLDAEVHEVKSVNDWIISGRSGWQHPFFENKLYSFPIMDIMDDMQFGTSLKSIEGHLFMNIEETQVSFDIDRPMTVEELNKMIYYCKCDVDATEIVVNLRHEYLDTKRTLGKEKGLSEAESLSMTNAKLTAAYLNAHKSKDYGDEHNYQFPEQLLRKYIPTSVVDYFTAWINQTSTENSTEIEINGCPVTIGLGGIHGAIKNLTLEAEEGKLIIANVDVASYYPNLMINFNYISRNISHPQDFSNVVARRIEAKKNKQKNIANALKLIINTTYGATLNQYNDLYDPLMARSVCISGQLFLLELTNHLVDKIKHLKIIQLNTDGLMVAFDPKYRAIFDEIITEWQERTGFVLEEDHIKKIIQKDVNNYIEIATDGSFKLKGAYFKTGINTVGAFSINNNMTIVSKAIIDYFTKGIPVEQTIYECDDIKQFQLIAKASSKYDGSFQYVNSERVELQKCNRVYSTKDSAYSTLYKYKGNSVAKISDLPEHCIIDNTNVLTIDDIDKEFYVKVAKKRIMDFTGQSNYEQGGLELDMPKKETTVEEKAIETAHKLNIYQKLSAARMQFLGANVEKSGKNTHQKFKYFELEDIVPVALPIFNDLGLVAMTNINPELKVAEMTIINADNLAESIKYQVPIIDTSAFTTNSNVPANNMQHIGAMVTYARRYLYMLALDIVEPDLIDSPNELPNLAPAPKISTAIVTSPTVTVANTSTPKTFTMPASAETRAELKSEIANVNDQADALQLQGLKNLCAELFKKSGGDPKIQEALNKIINDTQTFTTCTKQACEQYILAVQNKIASLEEVPF